MGSGGSRVLWCRGCGQGVWVMSVDGVGRGGERVRGKICVGEGLMRMMIFNKIKNKKRIK